MDSYMAFRQIEEEELLEVDGGSVKGVGLFAEGVAVVCGLGSTVAKSMGYDGVAGGLAGVGAIATTVSVVCKILPLL